MKYVKGKEPIICMQTQSKCYKGTKPMKVLGVLWHSTGANNPWLSRYVQPSDDAPDRAQMLVLIGTNKYGNDINHKTDRSMGVNAWIGKLADGSVATVQAMPWNWAPWGCGAGDKGSCNNGWIQFEICEDALTDAAYAMAAYDEACQLTAYLCRLYGIDPHGTVRYKGVDVPTILDHRTSHLLGLGSNHGDIANWFPSYGKNMATVRDDVAAIMQSAGDSGGTAPEPDSQHPTLRRGDTGEAVREVQQRLADMGYDLGKWGVDGDFGAATESAVRKFQTARGLTADGIVGPATWAALEDAQRPRTYTITIHGVQQAEMEKMLERWPECEVTEEVRER